MNRVRNEPYIDLAAESSLPEARSTRIADIVQDESGHSITSFITGHTAGQCRVAQRSPSSPTWRHPIPESEAEETGCSTAPPPTLF